MVMSASSARRASCLRSPFRRLSENWITSSAGGDDPQRRRLGDVGRCVGIICASAERSAVTEARSFFDITSSVPMFL